MGSSPSTLSRKKNGLSAEGAAAVGFFAPFHLYGKTAPSSTSGTLANLNPDFRENKSERDRGGSSVYVQLRTNRDQEQEIKKRIEQPKTYVEKHLDNEEEILVTKFGYEEFVWWSDYLTGGLPDLYKQVLEKLGAWKSYYDFELQGFTCFRHKPDKSRRCAVERIYLPQIRCGKYHPYASIKHKRRACMRTLGRLEYLEKSVRKLNKNWRDKNGRKHRFDYLVKLDLTLEKWVSLKWNDRETQVKIRNARKRFLELLHDSLFPNKKSEFGAIGNNHYWRTGRPLEPHRHLHLTLPNVCYNKSKNKFYRFEPYIDEKTVKECWKDALVEQGFWVERKNEKGEEVLPDCWVGYIKFSDRSKVIHRLTYCCRKPSEDMTNFLEPEDLEHFEDSKEFAGFLINYTPRVVNLGFLTNLKRFGYYSNKSKCMICPICGGEMVALTDKRDLIICLDRPPPNTPNLLRDREGIWYALS